MRARALLVCLLVTSCATPQERVTDRVETSASLVTRGVVKRSPMQRFVKEAPAVVRSGVARLVTLVPLDEKKSTRLAPAVSAAFVVDRLEVETSALLEKSLTTTEIEAFGTALDGASVAAVVTASVAQEPDGKALERFVEDPKGLTEERRARVKALVDASWSSSVLDKLSRAPVAAAGRVVAAALADDDDQRRTELLRIAQQGRPTDPDALVVAFAFLWRELDDAVLEEATAYFTSAEGKKATDALLLAATTALVTLTAEVEKDVR